MFAGRVKIVSHSSCRASAILKYFCPLCIYDIFYVTMPSGRGDLPHPPEYNVSKLQMKSSPFLNLSSKIVYLYPPQTLFVGGILFSRPSVRASVRNVLFP